MSEASDLERIAQLIVAPLKEQLQAVGRDAREARDGMLEMRTAVANQNLSGVIESFKSDTKIQLNGLRQDFVHALTNVKLEIKDVADDVEVLKEDKEHREGGLMVVRLMKDYGGWFIGLGSGALVLYDKFTK